MGGCHSAVGDYSERKEYLSEFFMGAFTENEEALDELTHLFVSVTHLPGRTIFTQDEDIDDVHFYLIVGERHERDVEVEVIVDGKHLCYKYPGDSLTFRLASKNYETMAATCVVSGKTSVTTLVLPKTFLTQFMGKHPDLPWKELLNVLMGLDKDLLGFLREIDILKGCPDDKLRLLCNVLQPVMLNEDDILFHEGSVGKYGSSLYIVVKGACRAAHIFENEEEELHLRDFKRGEFFGEVALILGIPRTSHIIANEDDTLVLELRKADFENFLQYIPNTTHLESIVKRTTAEQFRKYNVPFFENIPDEKYPILSKLCKIEQIEANTVLFSEGDIGHEFYIIAHGECKVTVREASLHPTDPSKAIITQKLIDKLGPGSYFGEIALVRDQPRMATVSTTKRSVILSLTKDDFESFFLQAPEVIADFELKMAREHVSLRSILYHSVGLKYFIRHLAKEISLENVEFWRQCRNFRHLALGEEEKEHDNHDENDTDIDFNNPLKIDWIDQKSTEDIILVDRLPTLEKEDEKIHLQTFAALDVDMRKSISKDALKACLRSLDCYYTDTELQAALKRVKYSDGKGITFPMFKTFMRYNKVRKQHRFELLVRRARLIYNTFIASEAQYQVNIIGYIQASIKNKVEIGDIDATTFDEAEDAIIKLMAQDSFARFKAGESFKRLLENVKPYKELQDVKSRRKKSKLTRREQKSSRPFQEKAVRSITEDEPPKIDNEEDLAMKNFGKDYYRAENRDNMRRREADQDAEERERKVVAARQAELREKQNAIQAARAKKMKRNRNK